jgi:hypothetical protein
MGEGTPGCGLAVLGSAKSAFEELHFVAVGIGESREPGNTCVCDFGVGWLDPQVLEPSELGVEIAHQERRYGCRRALWSSTLVESEPHVAVDLHVLPCAMAITGLNPELGIPLQRAIEVGHPYEHGVELERHAA